MRKLKNWIDSYLEYTQHQESPENFHQGVALAILSMALERKVSLFRGYWNLYPNLYVFLVSASGATRRSVACNIGIGIFKQAVPDRSVYAQKCTEQSLIRHLHEEFKKRGVSGVILCADEIVNMFKKDDIDLLGFVTKLYDCPDSWMYDTIARGKEHIEKGWCAALLSSAPDWLKLALPSVAIGGGFTSRLLIIFADGTHRRIPRPERYITPYFEQLRMDLVNDLRHISKLLGKVRWSKEGEDWYDDWYMMIYNPDAENTQMVGYYGRKHELLLKIAILLRVAYSDDLTLEVPELERALEIINTYEHQIPGILKQVSSSEGGEVAMRVAKVIEMKGTIPHSKLLQRFSYKISAKELADIIETLAGEDRIEVVSDGGKSVYKWKK